MKKTVVATLLATIFLMSVSSQGQAAAPKKYNNCTEMKTVYPGGVAKVRGWKNKGGELKNTPTVNAKVYALNSSKDRDKDGIVCES